MARAGAAGGGLLSVAGEEGVVWGGSPSLFLFTPPTSLPPFPKNRKNIVLKTKYIRYFSRDRWGELEEVHFLVKTDSS
jgi:hypothetical protein